MYVYQKVRAHNFARAWGYIQVWPIYMYKFTIQLMNMISYIRSFINFQIQNTKAAHTVQNGLAIYIQMHKGYVPTEMQNTKGVHSIYIEKGGEDALYLQSGRDALEAAALFESTTPPLAIHAQTLSSPALRRWG